MRFGVYYLGASWNRSIGDTTVKLNFCGEGSVLLHETALIFQGRIPKFHLWFINIIYHEVINIPTTRTIPYYTISSYKKPTGLMRANVITYRLPDGKKCDVEFRVKIDDDKMANRIFSSRLEDYLITASSFNK